MAVFKRCACGASWSPGEWRALELAGSMTDEDDLRLELRHCDRCGSTIAVRLTAPPNGERGGSAT